MLTKEFLTAGNAIFTVENGSTHLTYKVTVPDRAREYADPMCFLSVMSGSGNEDDYTYLGKFFGKSGRLVTTRASAFEKDALIFRTAKKVLQVIYGVAQAKEGTVIRHSGKCGRCGRTLTTPESLDSGIGPECKKREGQPRTTQGFRRMAKRGTRFGGRGQGFANMPQKMEDGQ